MKRQHFSRPEPVPYLIYSSHGNHGVFLGSLMSSQSSGRNNHANWDEDKPSFTYGMPLQRWIDWSCGYPFRKDFRNDHNCDCSFQQDFLPPTHLHEFYFMIDYMFICAHDYYVLELYFVFHMIKHRGKCFHPMIRWLHWFYDFTWHLQYFIFRVLRPQLSR